MILIDKRKKETITFWLGCLSYFTKMFCDCDVFEATTNALTVIAVELGIDWNDIQAAAQKNATWYAFQSDDL